MTSFEKLPVHGYEAVVDMGSNGIRFSITDVSPHVARLMRSVYQERLGVSLYDAQWVKGEKVPIPDDVVEQVIQTFQRWKAICKDFGVEEKRTRVVATEATRVALNSEHFQLEIRKATGWTVELLSKRDEGMIGAYGIASSLRDVSGLCMDLGGGSTQLSWIYTHHGDVKTSDAAVSLPYGAAALTQNPPPREEIISNLREAYNSLSLCQELQSPPYRGNLNLYLSGGGFRGWGFALMDQHPLKPYPIPIINGFSVPASTFHNTGAILSVLQESSEKDEPLTMHRISKRRIFQIPAVANLVSCVAEALPAIKNVYFCQGGVREGIIFYRMHNKGRAGNALWHATADLIKEPGNNIISSQHRRNIASLLETAITEAPQDSLIKDNTFLEAFSRAMYFHSSLPKDIRAASALHFIITGPLAGTYGIDHQERAAFAIALCERHGSRKDLDPASAQLYDRLVQVVPEDIRWWVKFLGRVAALIATVHPTGNVSNRDSDPEWRIDLVNKEYKEEAIRLNVIVQEGFNSEAVDDAVERIEKLGKRKQWGPGVSGHKTDLKLKVKESPA